MTLSIEINQFSIKFDKNWPIVDLNRIEIVATIDRTAKFGSKKSIKRQFESNLERNLAGGRLHHISLQPQQAIHLFFD